MEPEHWRQVEEVYHSALSVAEDDRANFLQKACADNEVLRREVESLLAFEKASKDFIETPALELAAKVMGPDETILPEPDLIGRTVTHYRVLEKLGGGGMGVVYKAEDTKLGRKVALKFLPEELSQDERAVERFQREARAASALNHPHICTIHDIDEHDGRKFIVMELLEGQTLKRLIGGKPLPWQQLADLGIQIADALQSAHAGCVIHRDIKPANIFITQRGEAKILDFGVAKLISPTAETTVAHDVTHTQGAVGTLPYMSPEQLRGQTPDARVDIYGLGAALYEMATAHRPFEAGNATELAADIIHKSPRPPSQLNPDLPPRLDEIILKCLGKEPANRYPSAKELLADLRRVSAPTSAASDGGAAPVAVPRAGDSLEWRGAWRHRAFWASAFLVLLAGALGYRLLERGMPAPQFKNPTQVTSAIGVEDYPTWSPDGRTLAYESNETGNWDIWMTQLDGQRVNRTAGDIGEDRYPSWSPDGRQIAFWSDRDGGGYYVMSALGGTPQRVIATTRGDEPGGGGEFAHAPPEWSADGTELAATEQSASEAVVAIVSLATLETRRVRLPGSQSARVDLSWSRDGRFLAYVDFAAPTAETTQLWVLRLSDGKGTALTDGLTNVRSPRWSPDGSFLYFVSNRVGTADLWRQRMRDDGTPVGNSQQLTTGLDIRHAAFSPDGKRLAYSKGRWVSNVWRVPIRGERPATWADAAQITFDEAFTEFVGLSPDSQRLAFSSDRTGNQDLWMVPVNGGEMVRLTTGPAPDWDPRWSPDASRIAFYSYRTGSREIWTMRASGGPARQLTHSKKMSPAAEVSSSGREIAFNACPDWSPDGRELAFVSRQSGQMQIWVMPAEGGEARQLTTDAVSHGCPTWSPDGHWLAFFSNRQLWRLSAQGGEAELLGQSTGTSPRWSRDGERIYFVGAGQRAGNIWAYSFKDHSEQPVTHLAGRRGSLGIQALAVDGKYLYFTWRDDLGDIWVMDVAAK